MISDERLSAEEVHRLRAISRFENVLWKRGIVTIAGVDEAGRGPLAGPVVAAAVVLRPGTMIEGIDDSKLIPEDEREKLFSMITAKAAAFGVGIVGHDEIDRINILEATYRAMHAAVESLPVQPEFLLIDGNSFPATSCSCRTIVKGDARSISIGAASIVAKVTRDRLMREYHCIYPEYGFDRHKGYGTAAHLEALRIHGPCPIHRKTFHVRGSSHDG